MRSEASYYATARRRFNPGLIGFMIAEARRFGHTPGEHLERWKCGTKFQRRRAAAIERDYAAEVAAWRAP